MAAEWVGARPRYMTPRSPDRPTLGPRIAELMAAQGRPPMPWQRELYDVAGELDPRTGYLAYGEVDIVIMRQQGKSEGLYSAMSHRCVGFDKALVDFVAREFGIRHPLPGPQSVLYLAQTADEARKKWRDVHVERLKASPLRAAIANVRLEKNREAIFWRNGSVWSPGSRTAKTGGTGDSLDMPVLDEGWSHPSNRAELGVRPAMMTRPWAQLWVASMVPGPTRAAPHEWPFLRTKMKAGRARVEAGIREGVLYLECSAEPGLDPGDPATWWSCMPALGHTIQEHTIRKDYESMRDAGKLPDFEAEYLGWEPNMTSGGWSVIGESTWSDRYDSHSQPLDPVSFGLSAKEDRSVGSISLAARRADDDVHVELVDRRAGVEWMVERTVALVDSWGPCAVVVDPGGPANSLIVDLRNAFARAGADTKLITPNGREIAAACGRFFDATGEVDPAADPRDEEPDPMRLHHIGQAELTQSIRAAGRVFTGQLWRWDPRAGDATPVESCTLALLGGHHTDWAGGSYAIRDSLG